MSQEIIYSTGSPYIDENDGKYLAHNGQWSTPAGGGGGSTATLDTTNTTSLTPSASESLASGTVNLHKISKTGNMSDLADVSMSQTPTAGQTLVYGSGVWTNGYVSGSPIVNTTYSSIMSLISGDERQRLSPGQLYRITDYVTKTAQANTSSAHHQFDLIVLATSESTLHCRAMAEKHVYVPGEISENYFNSQDLSKWQVWYDVNNDTTKYAWADDTNGKGVIYRLIDEWGNDCPYDFKNIRFTKQNFYTDVFTFNKNDDGENYDCSIYSYGTPISDLSSNNTIKPYISSNEQFSLNFVVFNQSTSYQFSGNTFGNNCHDITIGGDAVDNIFGDNCHDMVFGTHCINNKIGCGSSYIVFGNSSNPSIGGDYLRNNIIEPGNQHIRLYQTEGTAGINNQLQNVYIAQGVNNTTTWYDISTISRNLSYRTTVAMNKAGTDRVIYCEDDIIDMLPSISGNSSKVLAVNSGATGIEWVNNTGGGSAASLNTTNTTSLQTNSSESLASGIVNLHKVSKTGNLSDMVDTTITNPTDGQVLIYDNTTSKWINSTNYNDDIRCCSTTCNVSTDNDNEDITVNWTVPYVTQYILDRTYLYDTYPAIDIDEFFKFNKKKKLTVFVRGHHQYTEGAYPSYEFWVKNGNIGRDFYIELISPYDENNPNYGRKRYVISDKSELVDTLSKIDFFKAEIYQVSVDSDPDLVIGDYDSRWPAMYSIFLS